MVVSVTWNVIIFKRRMKIMKTEINLGIANILTIAFVILKLCHVINWSWWFVLSPTILLFCIPMLILGAIFLGLLLVEFLNNKRKFK